MKSTPEKRKRKRKGKKEKEKKRKRKRKGKKNKKKRINPELWTEGGDGFRGNEDVFPRNDPIRLKYLKDVRVQGLGLRVLGPKRVPASKKTKNKKKFNEKSVPKSTVCSGRRAFRSKSRFYRSEWRSIGLLAVTVPTALKNEFLVHEDIYKGIHDDENNVCLRRATIFSSFLPLVLCCLVLL